MIDVGEKREFLVWLINNVSFQRRSDLDFELSN